MALKKVKPDPRFTSKKKPIALAHARGTSVKKAKKQVEVERDIARIKKGVVRPVRDEQGFTAADRQIGKNKQLQAGRQAEANLAPYDKMVKGAGEMQASQPSDLGINTGSFWTTTLGSYLGQFIGGFGSPGNIEEGTTIEKAGKTLGAVSTIAAIGGAPGLIDDALTWASQGIRTKQVIDTAKTAEIASQVSPGLKKLLGDALYKVGFKGKKVLGNVKVTSKFYKGRVSVPYIPAENLYKGTTTLSTASKLVAGNAKNAGIFKQILKGAFQVTVLGWMAKEILGDSPIMADWMNTDTQKTLNFMQQDAIKTGDQELIEEVFTMSEALLDEDSNRNLDKGKPFFSNYEASNNARDANRLRLTLNRYINDQQQSGMSESDQYQQYLSDKTESELMLINAYEESVQRNADYKKQAYVDGNKEAAAYWEAKATRDAAQHKKDQLWLANMWLEYTKQKGEIGTTNMPSALNFGLI